MALEDYMGRNLGCSAEEWHFQAGDLSGLQDLLLKIRQTPDAVYHDPVSELFAISGLDARPSGTFVAGLVRRYYQAQGFTVKSDFNLFDPYVCMSHEDGREVSATIQIDTFKNCPVVRVSSRVY